ncbi:hypothetical protein ASPZODRAFT_19811 [Penicilliopsis zonata CBS 506.65]|uniref:Pop1 N-terminal domain-containing protein n=1 Tax=Penicilliopsis zonata CBS 506.65 TaxID=1073090 RepID=A0A1L9S7J0_9EURO|nr:hypothetical protein ASPZODRAFT_19811 [Penicilliopsis zonata CBS 506.65]OJJ43119.1 hypothetical protein ASPZODRAFT_19811 [Penicilliopsis zonata CBS 506.65]
MAFNPSSSRRQPGQQASASASASAAARKRAKTQDARSLAVQAADAALSATGELDVAAFIAAREFEIRALEKGMKRSREALTSRAFQKVPRCLRRRTASHNVKRVPRRLRARAKREMIEDNTPTVTARRRKPSQRMRIRLETARRLQGLNAKTKLRRAAFKAKQKKQQKKEDEGGSHDYEIAPRIPKIKKNKLSRPNPPESTQFSKRQKNKTWLPTHMFHAKRAQMTPSGQPLWRFALPLSPTEKSYRPSHRARGARGAIAWDVSYMSTIQLEGSRGALENVLRVMGVEGEDAWGVGSSRGKKWRAGTRTLQTWLLEREGVRRPIAPVTLIWCGSRKEDVDVEMVDVDNAAAAAAAANKCRVWIRIHPSAFLQLWKDLLEVSKRQNPPVMVEDLRYEIGSIDITGPGSTEALISTLQPVLDPAGDDSPQSTWKSLAAVTNPSSLPLNALLAFSATDPRLRFPPKTVKPRTSEADMSELAVRLADWAPDHTQGPAALFDRPARLAAARRMPSQKAINRRRTLAGPGVYPAPQATDPQIPIIAFTSRPRVPSSNTPGTWTILLPWKCVTAVWYSLMFYPLSSGGVPRFGGIKEQQQLAFEAGEAWFPGDFPGTRAGWEWGLQERETSKQAWERKPKGRRPEFDSLDLGNGQRGELGRGWACDWEVLTEEDHKEEKGNHEEKDLKEPLSNIYQLSPAVANLALHPRRGGPTVQNLHLHFTDGLALATVRISLYGRGTPTPHARIYRLPSDESRQKWLRLLNLKHDGKDNDDDDDDDDDDGGDGLPLPTGEDLIGFVTTGNYNLSEGAGTGIGSISVGKVCKSKDRSQRKMCIIRAAGERVGRLGYWEVA